MSYILWDSDEWENVSTYTPCPCHGKCNGCCTGTVSFGMRRRDPAEVLAIKERRQREHEEKVLAEADRIMARRETNS